MVRVRRKKHYSIKTGRLIFAVLFLLFAIAAATGFIVMVLLIKFTKGKKIGNICTLTLGEVSIDRSDLYVDGMFVTSEPGTVRARELFLNEGVAIVVHPPKDKFRLTLDNYGQRQAMLFESARSFGAKRFRFTRRNFKEGKLIIAFVPIIKNPEGIMDVIRNTPVLENSRKLHSIMSGETGGVSDGEK